MGDKVEVTADALYQVLTALAGPPHLIRELQVARGLNVLLDDSSNPIDILIAEYVNWQNSNG